MAAAIMMSLHIDKMFIHAERMVTATLNADALAYSLQFVGLAGECVKVDRQTDAGADMDPQTPWIRGCAQALSPNSRSLF